MAETKKLSSSKQKNLLSWCLRGIFIFTKDESLHIPTHTSFNSVSIPLTITMTRAGAKQNY